MSERETSRHQWQIHRSGVTEGSPDSDLTASTKKWLSVSTAYPVGLDGLYFMSSRHMKAEIRFRTNGGAGDTADYSIYLFRDKGDAKFCASGVVTFGLQEATTEIDDETTYYGHAISVPNESWIYPVIVTQKSNQQASIVFDAAGYNYILVLITASTLTGSGKKVAVDITGWN